jgi:chromosome segregation ATPase
MADEVHVANQMISWAVGVPSVGVIIAYGISIIRRRVAADAKSMNEDKSYGSMLESYRKERDETKVDRDRIIARMTTIETERNEAVGKVGKLTAEVEFLSSQVGELKTLVEKLGNSLDLARAEMQRFAVENAKLSAHVSYLEEVVETKNERKSRGMQ